MLKSKFVVSVIFAAGLSGLASLPAVAKEPGEYFGVRYVLVEFEDSDSVLSDRNQSFDLPMLMFNVGWQINPHFAIEGRFGSGVGDDSGIISIGGDNVDFDIEIDTWSGLFARVDVPTSDTIYPYFQLGYVQVEAEFVLSVAGESITVAGDDNNFDVYGFGVEFGGDKVLGNFEWMAHPGEDSSEISFGAVFRF